MASNGQVGGQGGSRRPSERVKAVVNYEEKRLMADIQDDIQHGVVHPAASNELEARMLDLSDSWESESLFADAIDELAFDPSTDNGVDAFPADEAATLRQELRAIGPEAFCKRRVDSGMFTAKKLLTAFHIKAPDFLEGRPDDAYYSLLVLAMGRELQKRAKLTKYNSIDDAVELLQKAKNIIVLTGAGISTSLGIPDFRSQGTGLYSKIADFGLNDPQEVFDIKVFKENPTIFYQVAKDILPDQNRFSPTHAFIALLQQKGKLMTNYSQNIDNLEAKAGISPDKLVQCHGSFATASCINCGHKCQGDLIFDDIRNGVIPRCPKCAPKARTTANSRKRKVARDARRPRRRPGDFDFDDDDDDDDDDDAFALASEYDLPSNGGIMKPDITFFGEALPDEFSRRLTDHDRDLVDLVIVIGTSLKVAPVSEVVAFLPPHVPQIYISRQPVSHVNFDIDLLGDCDIVVSELCRRAGWDLRHDMIPANQLINTSADTGVLSRHTFVDVTVTPPELPPPGVVPTQEAEAEADAEIGAVVRAGVGEARKAAAKKPDLRLLTRQDRPAATVGTATAAIAAVAATKSLTSPATTTPPSATEAKIHRTVYSE